MPEKSASRGLPVPSFFQLALIALAICAGCLIWSQWRGAAPDSTVEHPEDRARTARALDYLQSVEALAREGAEALPELIAGLNDADPRMRRNALLALRQLRSDADEALAAVRERLTDDDPITRAYAVSAYWHIRRDPDDVATIVTPMLADESPQVPEAAAEVLQTIGPPAVGPITELLRGDAAAGRVPALQTLRRIGWDASQAATEDTVRRLAGESDAAVRLEALLTLARWGRPTSAEIRELLDSNESSVGSPSRIATIPLSSREAALHAIIRLGPAAAENLPDVISLLNPRMPFDSALAAVRSMKTAARPAVPALLKMFEAPGRFRPHIGWTLLEIGAEPSELVRIAVPFLADKDPDARFHAGRLCANASPEEARKQVSILIPQLPGSLHAIWGLAPEAREAVPALTTLLEGRDASVARIAGKALRDIGPDAASAIPTMRKLLALGEPRLDALVRDAICEALGAAGPAARSALPELLGQLKDQRFMAASIDYRDQRLRPCFDAISALAVIGDRSPAILSGLRALLSSKNSAVQLEALGALVRLAPDSPEVLGDLLKWLSGSLVNGEGRVEIILAIGRLNVDRRGAVPPLVAALQDRDPGVRKAAAWTLGQIGAEAESALPALREALAEWKNSFQDPARNKAYLDDDAYYRAEIRRWHSSNHPLLGKNYERLAAMSVRQVLQEAIAAIEFCE
jgi:HEAT repeat protein